MGPKRHSFSKEHVLELLEKEHVLELLEIICRDPEHFEGVYKETCEHVLRVMREGQETLLTLLEAFVYDPLIDWTPFSEGGYTGAVYGGGRELTSDVKVNKKELMKEVACSMFKVRLTESKYQWMENKKTLCADLEDLVKKIKAYLECDMKKQKVQDLIKERHTQMALLKEAEGQPKHSLYTLHTRYSHFIQVHNAKEAVVQKLKMKTKECEAVDSNYHVVMQKLKGTDLGNWIVEVGGRPKKDVCQVFDLIKEFLSNAGQSQTVQQCIYSEKEVGELCLQQTTLTYQLLEMLRDYYEIARHYPCSHLMSHRSNLYRRWSEKLLEDMSPSSCDAVLNDIQKELLLVPEEFVMQVSMFSAGLERHLVDTTVRLQKCMERSSETSRVNLNPVEIPAGWLAKGGGHWGGEGTGSGDAKAVDKGDRAVSAVVLTALCALNKKFIMIESQAMSAGDSLMNLTSQAGDWFLHDMCSVAGNILRLTQLLPQTQMTSGGSPEDPLQSQINCALKCMHNTYKQLKQLQEMYYNFIGIILVEAIQAQVCEEPSVVALVDQLESIISSVQMPISDILKSLQLHLRYTVMNMAVGKQETVTSKKSPSYLQNPHAQHGAVMQVVEKLQAGFEALLTPPTKGGDNYQPRTVDQGEMLLMGFNGLFNLEIARNGMVHHLKQLATPPAWNIVDQIKEPQKYYARPMVDDDARKILDAMFFVKKLSTMVEVLRKCRCDARGFRGAAGKAPQVPHDFEALTKPMRKYIADYISTHVLGIFSVSTALLVCRLLEHHGLDVTGEVQQKDIGAQGQGNAPMEELCRKAVEYRTPELRTASGMVSQIEASWRQEDTQGRVARDLSNTQTLTQHLKVMVTSHRWLHDHLLVNTNQHNKLHIIARAPFLMEMRKAVMAMHVLQPRLKEAVEQQQALIHSAEQRLKWAAGANPALCEVMSAFESSVSAHQSALKNEIFMAANVCTMANNILTHEARRCSSEARTHDNAMLALVEECRQSYELSLKKPVTLSPAEQGLVSLKPPKKKIDAEWLSRTEELISASLSDIKKESEPVDLELKASEHAIRMKISNIKTTMAKHNHIIPDIKSLLKTLVKCDDSGLVGLDHYMQRYWKFVDTVNGLIRNFSLNNHPKFDMAFFNRMMQDIGDLLSSADSIYADLLRFSTNDDSSGAEKTALARLTAGSDSPRKSAAMVSKRDVGVVRNAYAISVWRKVKFKLEGRDPDPGIKNTVRHQVNWAIAEATNLDNLALLYEGWTPWV